MVYCAVTCYIIRIIQGKWCMGNIKAKMIYDVHCLILARHTSDVWATLWFEMRVMRLSSVIELSQCTVSMSECVCPLLKKQ